MFYYQNTWASYIAAFIFFIILAAITEPSYSPSPNLQKQTKPNVFINSVFQNECYILILYRVWLKIELIQGKK